MWIDDAKEAMKDHHAPDGSYLFFVGFTAVNSSQIHDMCPERSHSQLEGTDLSDTLMEAIGPRLPRRSGYGHFEWLLANQIEFTVVAALQDIHDQSSFDEHLTLSVTFVIYHARIMDMEKAALFKLFNR